ncbi:MULTISPECIES: hypothetical protein [unclassified Agromyces]|uniref:hypothetical protein n=1 Tax=unclassified Agromyces TaxID=2639701 RepID=UPI00301455BF
MDPNTARTVLRLDPAAPLSPEEVEQSYAREAWERHPSRYPDAEGRASAEAWAATLAEARAALLAEVLPPGAVVPPVATPATASGPTTDAAAPANRRRGLPAGAVIGIVAGSVVLLAALVAAGMGAAGLATAAMEQARVASEQSPVGPDDGASDGDAGEGAADEADGSTDAEPTADPGVERVEADEIAFTFPAALEMYSDGRYASRCGVEHAEGCWESALLPESDCATLEIELGFSNDADVAAPAEETRTLTEGDATAGEALPVVFGNDDYDYGWIQDVRCTSSPD